MNAARYFMRREEYQPRQTPRASPFRQFDVTCLHCGSYELRLARQVDEEAGEVALMLICKKCGKLEILPVR
jgi:transcription elongation factor Elf1